jgi:hypothetical protein
MKTVVVIVADPARAPEALRAAVGLTLRGDRVAVVPPAAWPDDPRVLRALATLRGLGHDVAAPAAVADGADAVEVWS